MNCIENVHLDTKMRYWVISYVCVPCFCFRSKSLVFTPNTGHYTPKSPCSSPNGLFFIPKSSYGCVPMIAFQPDHHGAWGCCTHEARCAKLVGGVDSNGRGCAGVRETILTQEIYCTNPNTKPDYQYGSWVCKGLGTQYTQSIHTRTLE